MSTVIELVHAAGSVNHSAIPPFNTEALSNEITVSLVSHTAKKC